MSKRILIIVITLALSLAACQGRGAVPPASETPGRSQGELASPTPAVSAAVQGTVSTQVATQPVQASPTLGTGAPGCTVVSARPTPGPTQESIFPPVSEKDWVQGPASAYITVIEYSDFQ